MSKYFGKVGYITRSQPLEDDPHIYKEVIVEVATRGYTQQVYQRRKDDSLYGTRSDSVVMDVILRIVATEVLKNHMSTIVYVTYYGTRYKVERISMEGKELLITLGDIYVD